jgi:hypothetical protein
MFFELLVISRHDRPHHAIEELRLVQPPRSNAAPVWWPKSLIAPALPQSPSVLSGTFLRLDGFPQKPLRGGYAMNY